MTVDQLGSGVVAVERIVFRITLGGRGKRLDGRGKAGGEGGLQCFFRYDTLLTTRFPWMRSVG